MPDSPVRVARAVDFGRLEAIERAAANLFSPDDLPMSLRTGTVPRAELERGVRRDLLWVTVDDQDVPMGFLLATPVDRNLHVTEMSVDPAFGRRGLGSALLETVLRNANERGYSAVTLTTFSHVPWNAPFYLRRGFRRLEETSLGPELAAILGAARARGLDHRVALAFVMRS